MSAARDSDPLTYHLVAADQWLAHAADEPYVPVSFPADGFIHCTNGAANLIDTANRYYREDPREFVALVIDPAKVRAEIRYEDATRIYPHIYGPLDREAIVSVVAVRRAADGSFLSVDE